MNYQFGAEEYNWLLERTGVTKVTMTNGLTQVEFSSPELARVAFGTVNSMDISSTTTISGTIISLQAE